MFILQTKLQAPELPQQVVGRPRLTASFGAGSLGAKEQPRFAGIFAPAGYGKTTLVLQLLEQRAEPASSAWFSIDATDNYFSGFWRYVWAAVFGRESKIDSNVPGTTAFHAPMPQWLDESQPEQIAAALIQSLAEKESGVTLVLDDFHHIQRQSILRSLARWKIKRYARTVYAADLVFTTEEIRNWFGDDRALEALAEEPEELLQFVLDMAHFERLHWSCARWCETKAMLTSVSRNCWNADCSS